jgi:hypothetical protein
MKIFFFNCLTLICIGTFTAQAQTSPGAMTMPGVTNPWKDSELIEPATLAAAINAGEVKNAVIYNIGVVEDIKGATHIGGASKAENLEKLKRTASALPKSTPIIIYCGCCPFAKCPNIRPAFTELKSLGFNNVKLLNLPVNLQTNWIAKGYPLAAK